MFKSVRWRSEKNKITAVFKLRFHATQVSQLGGNALVLSLAPADTGKPTAKLEKYEIRDGCCYWESTIFETVKFIQDPKTGKIHDRVYNCIISTGSSKSSILGEVSVNIAEYAGAIKAASVSLPLKGSNSDVALHVSIQRVRENDDRRELEEHEGAKIIPEEGSLKRDFGNGDTKENMNVESAEEEHLKRTVSNIELNGNRSGSIGSDITLSSSDSSSGLNTPREIGMRSNNMLLDSVAHNQQRTQWELSVACGHDSTTDDSTNSSTDGFPSGRPQLVLDLSVEKLKSYLVLLSRKAEVADLELQTLRKQNVKERKRGQDLLEEVACLKLERDDLKEEYKKFKASQKDEDDLKAINKSWALLEETRRELNNEKDLNVSLQLQLEKIQELNSELTLSVQGLKQMLEQSRRANLDPSAKQVSGKIPENLEERCPEVQGLSDDDEEQKALEEIVKQHTDAKETYILEHKLMDLCSEIEMYRRDKDELEMQMEQLALDYEILKQENHGMSHKLDQTHLQEQLKLQYDCSGSYTTTSDTEIRVKELEEELKEQSNELTDSLATIKKLENHVDNLEHELERQAQGFKDELEVVTLGKVAKEQQAIHAEEAVRLAKLELDNQIKKLEGDLKQKSKQHSDALATIKELEDQIQSLEEELDKQAQGFESDLEALTDAKVEQEQRAIRAEEALRLTRWKNANTAVRIQDEFKRLSMQMQSTFEANEKVATKAMTEASELRLINSHLEELVQQTKEELQSVKNDYEAQVDYLQDQLTSQSKQIQELLNQLNYQIEHKDEICQGLSTDLLMLKAAEEDRLTADTSSLAAQIEQGGHLKAETGQVKALLEGRDLVDQRKQMERENLEFTVDSANKEADKSLEELNAIKCSKNESEKAHCEELRHCLYQDELEKEKLRKHVILLEAELKKKEDAITSIKDNNGWAALPETTKAGSERSSADLATYVSGEATSLKDKIKMLEGLIKKKDTALETSANAFREKEKDLHNKIEELEQRFEELNHRSTTYCDYERRKDDGNVDGIVLNDDSHKPIDSVFETSSNRVKENGIQLSTSTMNSGDEYELCDVLKEMTSLRANNTFMENELKEMQDRYSEMSVQFAEVEGERQMLIMTLRSMKSAKTM